MRKTTKSVSKYEFKPNFYNVNVDDLTFIDLPKKRGVSKGSTKRVGNYGYYISTNDRNILLKDAEFQYITFGKEGLYQWYCINMVNVINDNNLASLFYDVFVTTLTNHGHKISKKEYVNSANPSQSSLLQSQQSTVYPADIEQWYNGVDATLEYWFQKVKMEHPEVNIKESITISQLFDLCISLGYDIKNSKVGLYYANEEETKNGKSSIVVHRDNGIGMTYSNMESKILSFNTGNKKNKLYQHGKHNAGATSMIKFSRFEFILTTMDDSFEEADGNYAFTFINHESFKDVSGLSQYKACYFLVDDEIPHFSKERDVEVNYGRLGDKLICGTLLKFYQVENPKVFISDGYKFASKLNRSIIDPIFVGEIICLDEVGNKPNEYMVNNLVGRLSKVKHYYSKGLVNSVRKVELDVTGYFVQKDFTIVPKSSKVPMIMTIFDPKAVKASLSKSDESDELGGIAGCIGKNHINYTLHGHAQGNRTVSGFKEKGKITVDGYYRLAESIMIEFILDDVDNILLMDAFKANRESVNEVSFIKALDEALINFINNDDVVKELVDKYISYATNVSDLKTSLSNNVKKEIMKIQRSHCYTIGETTAFNGDNSNPLVINEGTIVNSKDSNWNEPVVARLGTNKCFMFCTTLSRDNIMNLNNEYSIEFSMGKSTLKYSDYMKSVDNLESSRKRGNTRIKASNALFSSNEFKGAMTFYGSNRKLIDPETGEVFDGGTIKLQLPIKEFDVTTGLGVHNKEVYRITCVIKNNTTGKKEFEGSVYMHIVDKDVTNASGEKRTGGNPWGRRGKNGPRVHYVSKLANEKDGFISYDVANDMLPNGMVMNDNVLGRLVVDGNRLSDVYINASSKAVKSYLSSKNSLDTNVLLQNIYVYAIDSFSRYVVTINDKYDLENSDEKSFAYRDLELTADIVSNSLESYVRMLSLTESMRS